MNIESNIKAKFKKKIYTFNTIENFWRYYNNHPNLNSGCNFFLTRDDFFPMWEEVPDGSRLSFILSKKKYTDIV